MSIELNGTTGIDFNDGSNQSTSATPYGRKNLIINGDMRIAQRGTSSTGITAGGYYTIDRMLINNVSGGTFTMSQDTDIPSGQGFANSVKMACTATNTPTTNDQITIGQRIESQNLQHLSYGTASAKSLTLSFWVKSNKTGNYAIWFFQEDDGRQTNKVYTINSADTWEKKTVTISGDTVGIIDNDNGRGIEIRFVLGAGPDFTSGTSPNGTWEAYTAANGFAGQTVNLADSTSNYINITGVQLEVGDAASDFEFMPYDMELQRCQRYYEHNYNIGQTPGSSSSYPSNMGSWINGFGTHSGQKGFTSEYKVTKRATPSVTFYDTSGNSGKVSYLDAGGTTFNNQTVAIVFTGTSAILGTMGNGTQTGIHYFWVADSEL